MMWNNNVADLGSGFAFAWGFHMLFGLLLLLGLILFVFWAVKYLKKDSLYKMAMFFIVIGLLAMLVLGFWMGGRGWYPMHGYNYTVPTAQIK